MELFLAMKECAYFSRIHGVIDQLMESSRIHGVIDQLMEFSRIYDVIPDPRCDGLADGVVSCRIKECTYFAPIHGVMDQLIELFLAEFRSVHTLLRSTV